MQANPELGNEGMLAQILMAIQNLDQSSVATQNVVLEAVQKLLAMPIVGESGASNLAGCLGSIPPRGRDGNRGAWNDR